MSFLPRLIIADDSAVPLSNAGATRKSHPFLRLVENALSAASDARLLSSISDGDHKAFAELVQRHSTRFYHLAYRAVQSREVAEDIVQDAFLKIWENPHAFCPERGTAFTTWFYRVILNGCLDWQRRKPFAILPDDLGIPPEQDGVVQQAFEKEAIAEAIAQLPNRQQMAIQLCFVEGLSNQEAARIMGLHLKALQSLLMRAKKALQDKLRYLL